MVRYCSALGCGNSFSPNNNLTWHKFPTKNKDLCADWIKNVARPDNWKPSVTSTLCSEHFQKDCFYCREQDSKSRVRLRQGAVPTIFNACPNYLIKQEKEKKHSKGKNTLQKEKKEGNGDEEKEKKVRRDEQQKQKRNKEEKKNAREEEERIKTDEEQPKRRKVIDKEQERIIIINDDEVVNSGSNEEKETQLAACTQPEAFNCISICNTVDVLAEHSYTLGLSHAELKCKLTAALAKIDDLKLKLQLCQRDLRIHKKSDEQMKDILLMLREQSQSSNKNAHQRMCCRCLQDIC